MVFVTNTIWNTFNKWLYISNFLHLSHGRSSQTNRHLIFFSVHPDEYHSSSLYWSVLQLSNIPLCSLWNHAINILYHLVTDIIVTLNDFSWTHFWQLIYFLVPFYFKVVPESISNSPFFSPRLMCCLFGNFVIVSKIII